MSHVVSQRHTYNSNAFVLSCYVSEPDILELICSSYVIMSSWCWVTTVLVISAPHSPPALYLHIHDLHGFFFAMAVLGSHLKYFLWRNILSFFNLTEIKKNNNATFDLL